MQITKNFRDQHDDLLAVVTDITKKLDPQKLAIDAKDVRLLLSRLLGKLSVHLTMEDKSLYPRLLANPKSKAVAKKFMDEMGGLGKVIDTYKNKWSSARKIQEDPISFIKDTRNIFATLGKRIEKENNELYKIADEL
jgi:hemerythrin-like domain-containing protein